MAEGFTCTSSFRAVEGSHHIDTNNHPSHNTQNLNTQKCQDLDQSTLKHVVQLKTGSEVQLILNTGKLLQYRFSREKT